MLCDQCQKKEATVHLTSIINHQKKEQHLCSDCASQMQKAGKFSPFSSFASDIWDNNFFNNDFFTNMLYPDAVLQSQHSKRCPGCGITYDEFNRQGKFGCGQCYETFGDEISRLVNRLQGSSRYEGRIPASGDVALKREHQLKQLKEELQEAVEAEDFEKAVTLRDQIKTLEAQEGGDISC